MEQERQEENQKLTKKISPYKIIYPIIIGLAVVSYMLYKEFDPKAFDMITFTWNTVFWLFVAVLCMAIRDLGYIIRIKILSGGKLFVNHQALWEMPDTTKAVADGLILVAVIGYCVKLAYLLVLSYGLFMNPRGLKWLIMKLFKWRILRKWRHDANEAGTDIIRNSHELKSMPFSFWLKTFGATFFSWTARYWVVNAILVAFWFGRYDWAQHFLIFARQLVMWIMMLVSPTPGGSGFAEFVFSKYLGEFLPSAGVAIAMAILWRLISYYPYLFIGAFIVPKWIAHSFGKTSKQTKTNN